jgi:hypothetical protein
MSATMPVMVTDEIERALGYFEKNEFKSQYQITSKDADPYFITDKNFGTKD